MLVASITTLSRRFWLAVFFSLVGAYLFFGNTLPAAAAQPLDQLLADMGILKITPSSDPVEINLKDTRGDSVRLSDFRGKIVFLNFWASWCGPCRIEMPSMEKLHRRLKGRDFAIVAVNLQEQASRVKAFLKQYGLTFTVLLDTNGRVGARFGIRAIPTTFILDRQGRLIGHALGLRKWDGPESIALFEHLMDGSK